LQKKKDILIDKLVKKDYNNELEKILEQKDFDENVKNLLLGILYKLDVSYKDYQKVKRNVETKEVYIENILKIIQNECEDIKIVRNNSEEEKLLNGKTFLVDKENKKIVCYPIERKLLYSIEKIEKNKNIIHNEYFLINETLANTINIGNSINKVEVLRDFNGWSWSTVKSEIESIEYNLIYQNLRILLGEEFLCKWIRNTEYIIDYFELLKGSLVEEYGKKNQKEILESLQKLSILLEMKINFKYIWYIKDIKKDLENKLEKLNNKEQYIENIMNETKEIKQKIKQIDEIRSDKNLLKKEYENKNKELPLEKKIFSMRILSEMMRKEREKLYEKLEQKSKLLNPKEFVKEKTEIEKKLELCSIIDSIEISNNLETESEIEVNLQEEIDVENINIEHKYKEYEDEKSKKELQEKLQIEIDKEIILLQKVFLDCLLQKIQKSETKTQIIDLIYELRYYYLIPFNIQNEVYEIKEIRKKLEKITQELLKKAIEYKILLNISSNEKCNYEILANILKIRTIDLESIYIQIKKEKEEYYINIFDANSCEYKSKIENINKDNKNNLEIKIGKKIQIFI